MPNEPQATLPRPVEERDLEQRLDAVRRLLRDRGYDAVLVTSPTGLEYLTGVRLELLERPGGLVVYQERESVLVVPALEQERCSEIGAIEILSWGDGEDPWRVLASTLADAWRAGVERASLSVAALERIEAGAGVRLDGDISDALAEPRAAKSEAEQRLLRRSAAAVATCLMDARELLCPGISERDAGARLTRLALDQTGELAAAVVTVLAGPNAALPHGRPGDRPLAEGDVVLVDVALRIGGYWADMTRTYTLGHPGEAAIAAHAAVRQAQAAALAAIAPCVPCGEVDGRQER